MLRIYYSRGRSRIMAKVQKTYTQEFKSEVYPLSWRPEIFGLTHHLFISNWAQVFLKSMCEDQET
jgi:hypothetical protein